MTYPIVKVIDFEIVGDYTLRVVFDDQTEQIINFEPVLYGYYYEPLRDLALFNQVKLGDTHTLVWPNDADFNPATLHQWHQGKGAALARWLQEAEPQVE